MSIVNLTSENFEAQVGAQKLALVEFYAPWCTYCRRIAPAFAKVAEEYAGRVLVGQVNIDSDPGLADAHQVELVPTLMVFEDGKPAGHIVAPESKSRIDELLRQYL